MLKVFCAEHTTHDLNYWRPLWGTSKSCTAIVIGEAWERNIPALTYTVVTLDHICLTLGYDCSELAAACVEGSTSLHIVKISDQKKLQKLSELVIPGAILPNSLAFDSEGNLWAVSGCEGQIPFQISIIPASYFDHQNLMHSSSQNHNSTASTKDSHSWDKDRLRQICSVEMCEALQIDFAPNNNDSTSGHTTDSQARLPGAQVGLIRSECLWIFPEAFHTLSWALK